MKTIYTLAIALMSGVILTACVGAINIGTGTTDEDKTPEPENFQVARISFCGIHANKNHADCAVTLSRVTAASFLQSFDTPLPNLANATGHEFVQGTEIGLDTGEGRSTWRHTLNLASGDGNQIWDGDVTDGVAIHSIYDTDVDDTYYYAGIFSGTDLGLPRTETEGTVTWNGRFRAIGETFGTSANTDFTLTINFGVGKYAGTIEATAQSCPRCSGGPYYYLLTGNFDSSGVIEGTVVLHNGLPPPLEWFNRARGRGWRICQQ